MGICVHLFFVCVVLCDGLILMQGVPPAVYSIKKLKKTTKAQQRAIEP
jgi:hypothetical protein